MTKRAIVYDAENDESIELTDEEVKRFYSTKPIFTTKPLYRSKPKTGEDNFPDMKEEQNFTWPSNFKPNF